MRLNELKKGEKGKIKAINSDSFLINRFNSFGIRRNEIIELIEQTFSKETLKININQTKIALRYSEANKIEIEKINE